MLVLFYYTVFVKLVQFSEVQKSRNLVKSKKVVLNF